MDLIRFWDTSIRPTVQHSQYRLTSIYVNDYCPSINPVNLSTLRLSRFRTEYGICGGHRIRGVRGGRSACRRGALPVPAQTQASADSRPRIYNSEMRAAAFGTICRCAPPTSFVRIHLTQSSNHSGMSSRPLSSTWSWSWFGSLPVASPDPEQKYSTHAPWSSPTVRSEAVHGERDPQPGSEDDTAHTPPPQATTEYTTPIVSSYSISAGPRGVYAWDMPQDTRDIGRTGAHDPFADPQVSRINSNSTRQSVEAI